MKYTIEELLIFEDQLKKKLDRQIQKMKIITRRRGEDVIRKRFKNEDEKVTDLPVDNRSDLYNDPIYKSAVVLAENIKFALKKIDDFWQERVKEFMSEEIEIKK